MSISLDWSTLISKSPSELIATTEKSSLIDLFISHAPEVSKDVKLLCKLALLLNTMRDPQFETSIKKAGEVFSKAIHLGVSRCFVNLDALGSKPSLAELDGETLLTFAIKYCKLETVKELVESESLAECNRGGDTPLLSAVRIERLDALEAILEKKKDPHLTNSEACEAIRLACCGKDSRILKRLLTKDNVNLPVEKGELSPLWCAARARNEQLIDLIIERGGDIHTKHKDGTTLLMFVITYGTSNNRSSTLQRLIKHGADIKERCVIQGLSGYTAFYQACGRGVVDCLDLVYDPEFLNLCLSNEKSNPLAIGIYNGHLSVVKYLINKGANTDLPNKTGMTALLLASQQGHLEIVEYLLKHLKSDINQLERDTKCTPLMLALKNGKLEVAKYLIDQGARQDLESTHGYTALHFACSGEQLQAVKMLLDETAEAKINRRNSKGQTPLYCAAYYNRLDIARYLVSRSADQSGPLPPFLAACEKGSLELVQLLFPSDASQDKPQLLVAAKNPDIRVAQFLIEQGASPHSTQIDGQNVLHLACVANNLKLVEYLLASYPSLLDVREGKGRSPLLVACALNKPQIVKFLLDQKADLFLKDSEGMTALDVAVKEKSPEIIELLLDALDPLLRSSQGIIAKIKAYLPLLKYEKLKEIRGAADILHTLMQEYYTKRELQNSAEALCAEINAVRPSYSQWRSGWYQKQASFFENWRDYLIPFFSHFYKGNSGAWIQISGSVKEAWEAAIKRFQSDDQVRAEFKQNGLDAIFSSWINEKREGCRDRQSLDEVYQTVFEASREEALTLWRQIDLDNEIEAFILASCPNPEKAPKEKLLDAIDRKIARDPIAAGRLKACRDRIAESEEINIAELVDAEQNFNVALLNYQLSKDRAHHPAKRQKT